MFGNKNKINSEASQIIHGRRRQTLKEDFNVLMRTIYTNRKQKISTHRSDSFEVGPIGNMTSSKSPIFLLAKVSNSCPRAPEPG